MAKVMWIQDEKQFDRSRSSSNPGCMSSIFHALDYHYWHSNVKKILPHRKHEYLIKHTKGNRRYRRISDDQDPVEDLKLLDNKTSHIQMDQRNRKTSSAQKRSLKARIKALVSEDKDFVPSPKLRRTYSIHRLESNEWVNPISFFSENGSVSSVSSKTHPTINDSQDILDMFEVDKELFINTLQDRSQASVIKPKLIKSGSFPTAYRSLMPLKLKDKMNESYTVSKSRKIKNSNEDLNSNNVIRLRRISSLDESAERYAQLFDFSLSKEAILRSSRSLKLTDGSESVLRTQQPSSFRTNNSNQVSHDAYSLRSSSQNERNLVLLPSSNDKYAELNSTQDCDSLNVVIDKDSIAFDKDSHGLKMKEDNDQISPEITQQTPVLVPEYRPPDENVQISEGLDLLINLQENDKKEIKTVNSKKHMVLSTQDNDFTYVKKILERSGFLMNEFQQTWYSSNQPLDPLVFQEIESQYLHDPERFEEEINELSHRLLIFDSIGEVVVTMSKKSSTCYPKKLSSFYHIRPVPTGSHVLDEVWKRISQMINLKHDIDESLNDIVSRDLGSDDGWMNLHPDSECVALDLEDLIVDEVLEDLLFELF